MVDLGSGLKAIFFINPIDLFFFAPHDVPIIAIGLFPLSTEEAFVDAISKGCFEFNVLTM